MFLIVFVEENDLTFSYTDHGSRGCFKKAAVSASCNGGKAPGKGLIGTPGQRNFDSSDSDFELAADRAFYADSEKQYFIEI